MTQKSGSTDQDQYISEKTSIKDYSADRQQDVNPSAENNFFVSIKLKTFLSAVFLLAIVLGFNALFNLSTLDKLVTDSAVLRFHVIGSDFRRDINRSLLSGQSIHKLDGINEKLTSAQAQIEQFSFAVDQDQGPDATPFSAHRAMISIYLPSGRLLYSTADKNSDTIAFIPLNNPDTIKKSKHSFLKKSTATLKDGIQFLQFPVRDAQNKWVATVMISIKKEKQDDFFKKEFQKQIFLTLGMFLVGSILLIIFLNAAFSRTDNDQTLPRKKSTVIMFLVIAPTLVIFSGLNTYDATEQYLKTCQKKARMTVELAKQDIEALLENYLALKNIGMSRIRFQDMLEIYPELESLSILDNQENLLFQSIQKNLKQPSSIYQQMSDVFFSKFSFPYQTRQSSVLNGINQKASGTVSVEVSRDQIVREVLNMVLNAVTVVAISLLFLIELLIFVFHFIDRPRDQGKTPERVHFGLIRPVTFLFLFGIDISISFIPLHMENLYSPLFGLSRDALMGLPISVEFFFVGIAIFFCGFWNDRRGWYEPFLTGLFLAGSGVLYSWFAPNMIHFIASRAIVGIGYGLTLLAAQGFVIAFSDEHTKGQAFSQFIAGLYAGSICGGATGALLAEKMGYRWVFFLGAIILYSIIVYSLVLMRRAMIRPKLQHPVGQQPMGSGNAVFSKFLKNRIVLSLIFLSSLPASIAAVGFLNYFSPIYLNRIGASQATIGRVLMIYGFSLVYLGPIIGKLVDRGNNKRNYVFIGCLLGSVAFLMFFLLDGLLAATIAVLLLGLSNSYIIASQSTYLLKLKVTHALGAGKAIGIFRATSRIGQALGPIIFSGLIMSQNIKVSITKLGLFYLVTAVLFLLFTQKDENQ